MDLSVIVPTADRPDSLRRLLEGLAAQSLAREKFEVVLADDGSTPPVAAMAASFRDRLDLRYLWQERSGPGVARNRAIALARGKLLLILNDDAGPPRDLLARHLAAHATAPEPRVYLGGFDLAPDCITPVARGLLELGLPFPFHQMRRDAPNPGRFFWTCNLSVRRDVVLDAGGFDEAFRHPVCEDVELGYRLEKRGVLVHWLTGAPCLHHHRLTAGWFWRRQIELGRAIVQMWRKHGDPELMPWLSATQNDARLLEVTAKRLVSNAGRSFIELAEELDGTTRPPPPANGSLAPEMRRIDDDALRVGLLGGLAGWSSVECLRWLDSLPSLTSLVAPRGADPSTCQRALQLAAAPVELVDDVSQARGEWICFLEPGFAGTPSWLQNVRAQPLDDSKATAVAGAYRIEARRAVELRSHDSTSVVRR